MSSTRTLHGTAPRCCAVLLACLPLGAALALAQPIAIVESIPGLEGTTYASVRDISRDGRRVVVMVEAPESPTGPIDTLVLDTRTGATLFENRPADTATRRYDSATISPDGRFLAYLDVDVAPGPIRVRDLESGKERLVSSSDASTGLESVADGGTAIATSSWSVADDQTPLAFESPPNPPWRFGAACPPDADWSRCTAAPLRMSADGQQLAFRRAWYSDPAYALHSEIMLAHATDRQVRTLPIVHSDIGTELHTGSPWVGAQAVEISGDGRWVGFTGAATRSGEPRAALMDRLTGHSLLVAPPRGPTRFHDVSDDGRVVLFADEYSLTSVQRLHVVDRTTGVVTDIVDPLAIAPLAYRVVTAHLSGDGRTVVATLLVGWHPVTRERRNVIGHLDGDDDGLLDGWETTFGLDPADALDAWLDSDGDGRSNIEEYVGGTHPRGTPIRYFAEGASGAFFMTSLALFNPSGTAITANVRFLGGDGATASTPVVVPANGPAYLDADQVSLSFSEFSIVLESPVPLVAERQMTWDRAAEYGSHVGTGVDAPAPVWHFAEGATVAGMQTFFLLLNPGEDAAQVSIRYMLATGASHVRTHRVPPRSRQTVWANHDGLPPDAEFATTVDADVPVVAERAMYLDAPGEVLAAGSVTSGATRLRTSWLFAEGSTGPLFDAYLLLGNPGDTPADVDVDYLLPVDWALGGTAVVSRRHVVPPRSRQTVRVAAEDQVLAASPFAMTVRSHTPVVAERTMWWPGTTPATWRENHTASAVRDGGALWAVADVQADAAPGGWDTFLLVGTTRQFLSSVRVTVACADGTTVSRDRTLVVNRTTFWMRYDFPEIVGRRCAATVESLPTPATSSMTDLLERPPLIVEKAMYRGHFAAGEATLATRLPDPE